MGCSFQAVTLWNDLSLLSSNQLYRNKGEDKIQDEKQKGTGPGDSGKWLRLGPTVFNCKEAILKFLEGMILPGMFLKNSNKAKDTGKRTKGNGCRQLESLTRYSLIIRWLSTYWIVQTRRLVLGSFLFRYHFKLMQEQY